MYDFEQPNLSIDCRDEDIHLARKRVWSLGFGDKALRGFEPRVAVHTKRVLSMIESAAGKAIDVTKITEEFAFDVILDLGLGDDFDMLKPVQSHKATQQFVLGRRLPMWLFHLLGHLPFVPSEDKIYDEKLDQIIKDEKRRDRPRIMEPLIAHFEKLPPTERDMSVIKDDGKFIIVAGSDTVAATLGFIFYFLAKHPENVNKLRQELAPLRNADGTFARQQIQHAEHLNGVINETLRFYPPASTIQRITPPEGIMINGTFIPGGITVFTTQYVLGRLKDSFEKPEDFIPERWYSRPEMIKDRSGYAPFNTGAHPQLDKPRLGQIVPGNLELMPDHPRIFKDYTRA
jgi:tryprostatin B 6-hydroxylase